MRSQISRGNYYEVAVNLITDVLARYRIIVRWVLGRHNIVGELSYILK